jgi:hypothetical protein
MENAPNPSVTYSGNRLTTPIDRSEPTEVKMAKRRAWAQWYEARKSRARERYRQWAMRRSAENYSGMMTFDYMGRVAVSSAANTEQDPRARRQRRAYLMRKWREFMRRSF